MRKTCSKILVFFEGLLLSFALRDFSGKDPKDDGKALACMKNLIHLIQKSEPNSLRPEDPFEFHQNYSCWLHVLYYHMASIYTIEEASEKAAEAFENSLTCCPSYYDSKRGLGYNLMNLHCSKTVKCQQELRVPVDFPAGKRPIDREISKYASWTTEKLRDTGVKVLQEYLVEAPQCDKNYPGACYFLAKFAHTDNNISKLREYYELGQDVEEKRLPFFAPVDLPLKDMLSPFYQLFSNVKKLAGCGNKTCFREVEERDLKSCGRCGKQKYCSR